MHQPLPGALRVQLHFAALAVDRQDARNAQFGGLLQDPVHFLAAGDALQQGEAQRRLVVDMARIQHFGGGLALAQGDDAGSVVVAIAIEQHALVAHAQPQHAQQVRGHVFRQRDAGPNAQRLVEVAAGQAHAVASTMASRVTRASRSSCASSMQ